MSLLLRPMNTKATKNMKTRICLSRRIARPAYGHARQCRCGHACCLPWRLAWLPVSPTHHPLRRLRSAGVFDVRQFGAQGDGKTVDTAAIQKALDRLRQGRGRNRPLSRRHYLSQPITLRSKTTLLLEQGATAQGHGRTARLSAARA